MTREELRDYVDEQRTLDNIPYHVYSALIDGIDTLEQEPFNPMVEIDLYSVIKQKYIERDVLDKIKAEIKTKYDSIPWRNNDYDDGWVEALEWVFDDVIDKYTAESAHDVAQEIVKNNGIVDL